MLSIYVLSAHSTVQGTGAAEECGLKKPYRARHRSARILERNLTGLGWP